MIMDQSSNKQVEVIYGVGDEVSHLMANRLNVQGIVKFYFLGGELEWWTVDGNIAKHLKRLRIEAVRKIILIIDHRTGVRTCFVIVDFGSVSRQLMLMNKLFLAITINGAMPIILTTTEGYEVFKRAHYGNIFAKNLQMMQVTREEIFWKILRSCLKDLPNNEVVQPSNKMEMSNSELNIKICNHFAYKQKQKKFVGIPKMETPSPTVALKTISNVIVHPQEILESNNRKAKISGKDGSANTLENQVNFPLLSAETEFDKLNLHFVNNEYNCENIDKNRDDLPYYQISQSINSDLNDLSTLTKDSFHLFIPNDLEGATAIQSEGNGNNNGNEGLTGTQSKGNGKVPELSFDGNNKSLNFHKLEQCEQNINSFFFPFPYLESSGTNDQSHIFPSSMPLFDNDHYDTNLTEFPAITSFATNQNEANPSDLNSLNSYSAFISAEQQGSPDFLSKGNDNLSFSAQTNNNGSYFSSSPEVAAPTGFSSHYYGSNYRNPDVSPIQFDFSSFERRDEPNWNELQLNRPNSPSIVNNFCSYLNGYPVWSEVPPNDNSSDIPNNAYGTGNHEPPEFPIREDGSLVHFDSNLNSSTEPPPLDFGNCGWQNPEPNAFSSQPCFPLNHTEINPNINNDNRFYMYEMPNMPFFQFNDYEYFDANHHRYSSGVQVAPRFPNECQEQRLEYAFNGYGDAFPSYMNHPNYSRQPGILPVPAQHSNRCNPFNLVDPYTSPGLSPQYQQLHCLDCGVFILADIPNAFQQPYISNDNQILNEGGFPLIIPTNLNESIISNAQPFNRNFAFNEQNNYPNMMGPPINNSQYYSNHPRPGIYGPPFIQSVSNGSNYSNSNISPDFMNILNTIQIGNEFSSSGLETQTQLASRLGYFDHPDYVRDVNGVGRSSDFVLSRNNANTNNLSFPSSRNENHVNRNRLPAPLNIISAQNGPHVKHPHNFKGAITSQGLPDKTYVNNNPNGNKNIQYDPLNLSPKLNVSNINKARSMALSNDGLATPTRPVEGQKSLIDLICQTKRTTAKSSTKLKTVDTEFCKAVIDPLKCQTTEKSLTKGSDANEASCDRNDVEVSKDSCKYRRRMRAARYRKNRQRRTRRNRRKEAALLAKEPISKSEKNGKKLKTAYEKPPKI